MEAALYVVTRPVRIANQALRLFEDPKGQDAIAKFFDGVFGGVLKFAPSTKLSSAIRTYHLKDFAKIGKVYANFQQMGSLLLTSTYAVSKASLSVQNISNLGLGLGKFFEGPIGINEVCEILQPKVKGEEGKPEHVVHKLFLDIFKKGFEVELCRTLFIRQAVTIVNFDQGRQEARPEDKNKQAEKCAEAALIICKWSAGVFTTIGLVARLYDKSVLVLFQNGLNAKDGLNMLHTSFKIYLTVGGKLTVFVSGAPLIGTYLTPSALPFEYSKICAGVLEMVRKVGDNTGWIQGVKLAAAA